jgi:hypothetical protein
LSLSKKLIGRVLQSVSLDAERVRIRFDFADGSSSTYEAMGDCCSRSWIEHLELPANVHGARIMEVGASGPVEVQDPDHECLQVYAEQLITDRGEVVIEFRNSSNGYYGGYLEEVD